MTKNAIHPLYIWLVVFNIASIFFWNYGPAIFIFLALNLLVIADSYRPILGRKLLPVIPSKVLNKLCIAAGILLIPLLAFCFLYSPDWIVDIAENTDAAVKNLIEGKNPYTHRGQLWVDHFNSPHVVESEGQVTMFGVPYYFGFPYFPAMAISYAPMTALLDNFTGLRLTNLFLSLLNIYIISVLLKMHSKSAEQYQQAKKILVVLMVLAPTYIFNTIFLGITDILVSTYLLVSLLCIARKEFILAGVMLGLAQSSKLLPAPFALLAILVFINHQRHNERFFLGFMVTGAVFVLPFLYWSPEGFLSSTILYYLSHHQGGDVTSLWYFLPASIKPGFLWLGVLLSLVPIILLQRKLKEKVRDNIPILAIVIFASYLIFMAFSKMTHFNYYYCIYPLLCYVLAARWSSLTHIDMSKAG